MRSLVGELEYIAAENRKLEQQLKDLSGSERYRMNAEVVVVCPVDRVINGYGVVNRVGGH